MLTGAVSVLRMGLAQSTNNNEDTTKTRLVDNDLMDKLKRKIKELPRARLDEVINNMETLKRTNDEDTTFFDTQDKGKDKEKCRISVVSLDPKGSREGTQVVSDSDAQAISEPENDSDVQIMSESESDSAENFTIENVNGEICNLACGIDYPETCREKIAQTKPLVIPNHRQMYVVQRALYEVTKKETKATQSKLKCISDSSTDIDITVGRGEFISYYLEIILTRSANAVSFVCYVEGKAEETINDLNNSSDCFDFDENDLTRGYTMMNKDDSLPNQLYSFLCNAEFKCSENNTLPILTLLTPAKSVCVKESLNIVDMSERTSGTTTSCIPQHPCQEQEATHSSTGAELVHYGLKKEEKRGSSVDGQISIKKSDLSEQNIMCEPDVSGHIKEQASLCGLHGTATQKKIHRGPYVPGNSSKSGNLGDRGPMRALQEATDQSKVNRSSYIVLPNSDSLGPYKKVFGHICDKDNGKSCFLHADIPGTSRRTGMACSHSGSKRPNKSKQFKPSQTDPIITRKSQYRTSEIRGYADPKQSSESLISVTSHETNHSSTSETAAYQLDQAIVKTVTDLLHSREFSKILEIAQPYVESSSGISLIPLVFVAGLSHFKLGNKCEATSYFLNCIEICLKYKKSGDSALCYLYLGDIQFLSRDFVKASYYYQQSISSYSLNTVAALFLMLPPSLSAIHSKCGSALRNASKMVDAIQEYKRAIEVAKTPKDKLAANTSLGNLYQSVGENSSALSHYQVSIELAEKINDHVSLGWAHGNIGNAWLGLFQKEKALFHLKESLKLTLQFEPTPQAIGRAYNNLGTAYQSLNDLDEAQGHYDLALRQAVYGEDKAGQARVCGNMGNILMLRKKHKEAISRYSEVVSLSNDRSTLSTACHNRGCAYYEWGEAMKSKLFGKLQEKIHILKSYTILESHFFIHGYCLNNADKSLKPHEINDTVATLYRSGCQDLSEVIKYHEEHLNNIKGSSKGLSLSVSLFEANSRTFHRLQDCFVCLGEHIKALLVAEQSRARTLGELMLKSKGWQLSIPLSSPLSIEHIAFIIEANNHPVLYLSYTGARLLGWVFVFKANELHTSMFEVPLKDDLFDGQSFDYHVRCSLTESLVERSFEMYREVGDYDEDISAPVQTLYNLIGKPLFTVLQNYEIENNVKIVVICDSYTALIPFSSLHDYETDSFLGDRFCFQFMPSFLSMGILNQLKDNNVVKIPDNEQCMCIVGNPTIPQFKYNDEVWNLGKLPHAKREAESVAYILNTHPMTETQATKSAVLMKMLNSKIIHLATHGSASSGFLAFGVLVPIGQDLAVHSQTVLLYPEEVEKLNISPALVVLSSCDSGRGAVKADGIQGMARAFILAGAQAVLTTLWRVPDESAAIFMQFFYQYMKDGLESTKALQKAILSIRCFSKYSQYIHWSGYQLTGRDIYLKYTSPSVALTVEQRLGGQSPFPNLDNIEWLKNGLLNASCFPTDVHIMITYPGLDAYEEVTDFIHCSHRHFSGGIFWINCEQPEFIAESIHYIQQSLRSPLEHLQVSEEEQCLFVLNGISELPTIKSLHQLLKNRYSHCIMLYDHCKPLNTLVREIDHSLLRGCKTHDLKPLSMISATQRIVYSIQTKILLTPKCDDQKIIENIADFTCGSPILINIASQVLCSALVTSQQSPRKTIQEFYDSVLSNNDKNIFDQSENLSKYDSWNSIMSLLNASFIDHEAEMLLACLSLLRRSPIPKCVITSLSTIITNMSGRIHLGCLLVVQLWDNGFIKRHPCPVILHSRIEFQQDYSELVSVPKFLGDCLLNQLDLSSKVTALAITYQVLKQMPTNCLFKKSLVNSLVYEYEFNIDLVGEKCYQELYRLFLSLFSN